MPNRTVIANSRVTRTSRAGRYAIAAGAALVLNGALVLMLAHLRRPDRTGPEQPLRAVPLRVVEAQRLHRTPEDVPPAQPVVHRRPPPSPPLPTPPLPMPAPAVMTLAVPTPPAMPVPSASPCRMPLYVARAPAEPAPVAAPPSAVSQPIPAAPQPAPGPSRVAPDRGPVCLHPPDLSSYYPRRARLQGTTGKSTVRLTIGADGQVRQVEVLRGTPPDVFDVAARRAAMSLRFLPAVRGGRPVATTVSLNFVWRLE